MILNEYNIPGGPLPHTGIELSAPVIVALAIIIAALILRAR